jgi:hypothetical protein
MIFETFPLPLNFFFFSGFLFADIGDKVVNHVGYRRGLDLIRGLYERDK